MTVPQTDDPRLARLSEVVQSCLTRPDSPRIMVRLRSGSHAEDWPRLLQLVDLLGAGRKPTLHLGYHVSTAAREVFDLLGQPVGRIRLGAGADWQVWRLTRPQLSGLPFLAPWPHLVVPGHHGWALLSPDGQEESALHPVATVPPR